MPNPIFKVVPALGQVQVDFGQNLPVQMSRAFAVWDAENNLVDSAALAAVNPPGIPDWAFGPALPFPCTLAATVTALGPKSLIDQLFSLQIRIWQFNGGKAAFNLPPVKMKGNTTNGVTVAYAQKICWIGLVL